MTTLGQDCMLPLHYNGTQINACVNIHGGLEPVCYVENQGWQVLVTHHVQHRSRQSGTARMPCAIEWSPTASQKLAGSHPSS